jgi:hypothetical protein
MTSLCSIVHTGRPAFQEVSNHCRWKTVLREEVLTRPELDERCLQQHSGKSFDTIFTMVYEICAPIKGIGMLTVYDITAAICRYNKIPIDKVYIIGNGPKRAIQLLGITPNIRRIQTVLLQYVTISDLRKAFHAKHYSIDTQIKQCIDGDTWESYICNWQKLV